MYKKSPNGEKFSPETSHLRMYTHHREQSLLDAPNARWHESEMSHHLSRMTRKQKDMAESVTESFSPEEDHFMQEQFSPEDVTKRSLAARRELDAAARSKAAKNKLAQASMSSRTRLSEDFSALADTVTLVANQQYAEASAMLHDILGNRMLSALDTQKQAIAQTLFVPSADALQEDHNIIDSKTGTVHSTHTDLGKAEEKMDKLNTAHLRKHPLGKSESGRGGRYHLSRAARRLEEAEQLNELSGGTIRRYLTKSTKSAKQHRDMESFHSDEDNRLRDLKDRRLDDLIDMHAGAGENAARKAEKREAGIKRAARRLEEAEQLNELSGGTVHSYLSKATKDLQTNRHRERVFNDLEGRQRDYQGRDFNSSADRYALAGETAAQKAEKREAGIKRAARRLEEAEQLDEMTTRKHFQQVADIIKAHPSASKRKELAAHHAGIFKTQNPRFDHKRFYAAANAGEPGV